MGNGLSHPPAVAPEPSPTLAASPRPALASLPHRGSQQRVASRSHSFSADPAANLALMSTSSGVAPAVVWGAMAAPPPAATSSKRAAAAAAGLSTSPRTRQGAAYRPSSTHDDDDAEVMAHVTALLADGAPAGSEPTRRRSSSQTPADRECPAMPAMAAPTAPSPPPAAASPASNGGGASPTSRTRASHGPSAPAPPGRGLAAQGVSTLSGTQLTDADLEHLALRHPKRQFDRDKFKQVNHHDAVSAPAPAAPAAPTFVVSRPTAPTPARVPLPPSPASVSAGRVLSDLDEALMNEILMGT
ncbi:hypothetical protein AMAG_06984 [Allomyces macrogynus ATCC 38327]|uniref:Uncharacterized protein n=1 Tax=Allomyces macrogynus (strain ATCC 38327) TaxID=578462 RepID=A0A0L0SFT7_ALLM3|nr:hypothetical protein AMAG_06984 [Allomyces macrogynus ATCC 38327]|eukprot:KNE61235.1 hypothetical protein AMAG_06984 [Allomyces macrogynus ATCC 38327]